MARTSAATASTRWVISPPSSTRTTAPAGASGSPEWAKVSAVLFAIGGATVLHDVSVNVVFLGGADFASPPPLGAGDRSRYIKVRSWDEVDEAQIRRWIRDAGEVAGWQ